MYFSECNMKTSPQVIMIWTNTNRSSLQKNHSIATGLVSSGLTVTVITMNYASQEYTVSDSIFNNNVNIYASYFCGYLYKGKNKVVKFLNNIKTCTTLIAKLFKLLSFNKHCTIIIPRDCIEIILPVIPISKFFRSTLIANLMEYSPSQPFYESSISIRICWKLILKHSDAYMVISRFLVKKFGKSKPTFYLPAIIDTASVLKSYHEHSFMNTILSDYNINNIPICLYTSSSEYGELLEFCLKALGELRCEKFMILITGKYSKSELSMWRGKVRDHGLIGKVRFTGFIHENEFIEIQRQSKALLIPLLDNTRHIARFPQKVLEYMLIGRPVISTNVGEIAEYFTDNVNMFLDETISPKGYAEKIKSVLTNDQLVSRVTKNAEGLVKEEFDNVQWGLKLKSFIQELRVSNSR